MALIEDLQLRLQQHASPETRVWWERYLRGTASFRGVPMAAIRDELHGWYERNELGAAPPADQVELALELLRQPLTEDRLAGVLFFQEILLKRPEVRSDELVPRFAQLFEDGHLADWNSVDWFCVKVLGPMVRRDGEPCARAIAGWRNAATLWQRRASAVAFVNLVKRQEPFPGFRSLVIGSCEVLVESPERFSQTGAGWVLRELSRSDPELVAQFVRTNLGRMSREGVLNATRRLPAESKAELLALHKRSAPTARAR